MSSNTPQASAPRASVAAQVNALRAQLTSPGAPFELVQVELADGSKASAYRNAFPSLPDVLNAGRAHGAMEFLIYGEDRWTFDRFFAAADAAASRLQKQHGLKAGDRVAMLVSEAMLDPNKAAEILARVPPEFREEAVLTVSQLLSQVGTGIPRTVQQSQPPLEIDIIGGTPVPADEFRF